MGILKRTDNERNKSLRERDPFFGSFFDEMENLEVKLDQDILTISAHRKEKNEKKDEDKNYYRKEIRKGRFERRFRLPDNIDQDEIKANLKNGMLKINLPKSEETKTVKNIEIN